MNFTIDQASLEDIRKHLETCDSEFDPHLSSTVNLYEYSQKIEKYSTTFEVWSEKELTGLVAAYFNDPEKRTGFITNVSVLPNYKGMGLASRLMENVIIFAKDHHYQNIKLEVKSFNTAAIHLYSKFGFVSEISNENVLKMNYLVK
jgi:ribosomal protein S18 acetylase RimI-like enzyme